MANKKLKSKELGTDNKKIVHLMSRKSALISAMSPFTQVHRVLMNI